MTMQTGTVNWWSIQPSLSIYSLSTEKYKRTSKHIKTDIFKFTTHTGMCTCKKHRNPHFQSALEQYDIHTPCTMSNTNSNQNRNASDAALNAGLTSQHIKSNLSLRGSVEIYSSVSMHFLQMYLGFFCSSWQLGDILRKP